MDSDLIEKLLQTTGLSCDDLLTKLHQYRSVKSKTEPASSSSEPEINSKELKEECATNEKKSVILQTEDSSVDSSKVDEIHTDEKAQISNVQISPESPSDEKAKIGDVQISQKAEIKEDVENERKLVERQDSTENVSVSRPVEKEVCSETVENTDRQRRVQMCIEDRRTDSILDLESNTENLKNLQNGVDCRQNYKNEAEDENSFNFFKKNRRSKMKISDYLESILNCRKNEREDKENENKKATATAEDATQNDSKHTNLPVDNTFRKENLSMENVESCQSTEDTEVLKKQISSAVVNELSAQIKHGDTTESNKELPLKKSPKAVDHNYSNVGLDSNSQEETSTSNETREPDARQESSSPAVPKTEDNLRNILKLQLSSLRNMKKSSGYLPDLKKPSMFFHNLKKKRKSCDVNSGIVSAADDDKEESNEDTIEKKLCQNKETSSNENSLISLSEETDFVIMDVTGGVDRITPDPTSTDKEERRFAAVTDDKNERAALSDNAKTAKLDAAVTSDKFRGEENGKLLKTYVKKRYFSLQTNLSGDKEKLPNLSVKKSISENFKKDPGVNKSVKNSEKSPFVSDSLEDFLSESAQLKISYAIPKLGAEEGISESTKKSPYDGIVNKAEPPKVEQSDSTQQKDVTPKEPKLVKAKTLAEMRRHFEKLKAMEKGESDGSDTPALLSRYKKNKAFRKYRGRIKEDQKNTDQEKDAYVYCSAVAPHRNSIIMYDNKKLRVLSKSADKCVGTFYSKTNKEVPNDKKDAPSPEKVEPLPNKKLSILSSLSQNRSKKITYKPGPLCKKAHLQNADSKDKWITELKILPKIYLEVVPEIHKPIDPTLVHLLPIFDEVVITEDRVNFALSVLKPKSQTESDSKPQSFRFHVRYNNNQDQMVVRKPCIPVYKPVLRDEETDPTSEIASVLSDIITYVETKEIEDSLIKEDDFVVEPNPKVVESPTKPKKYKTKRKKVELELRRLSCKVIDVATNETQDGDCSKPFCKLGCICKSLQCDSVFSNHCQLVECMFGCKCSSGPSTDATTNNSLSVHTVNHLEVKAKRNMAKVERDFTQTFINTDNDAILVGTAKMRRSSKPPKKYTDYIAEDFPIEDPLPVVSRNTSEFKACRVVLQKLDLDEIVPYCMVHNLHDCHCKGEAISPPVKAIELEQIPKLRIVKTKEGQHKALFDSCARIRKVFPEYKERNKNPIYNEKLLMKNSRMGLGFTVPKQIQNDNSLNNSNDPESVKKPNKRKQSFNIREDVPFKSSPQTKEDKEFALQRRKKKAKVNISVAKDVPVYNPVFDGEIRVSLKDNEDMLKIIGTQHAALEYLRILPWSKLIELFRTKRVNIWAKENRPSVLLCNTMGFLCPKNFIDIRKVRDKTDIINWILTNQLPPDKPRELMHLILTPKDFDFLIAGYCLKKTCDGAQSTITSQVLQENVNKTLSNDSLEIATNSTLSKTIGDFEEICVDDIVGLNAEPVSVQEPNKEKSTDILIKPKLFGSGGKVSVFVNTPAETTKDPLAMISPNPLVITSSPNPFILTSIPSSTQVTSTLISSPIERRIKIVRPEMWICKNVVDKQGSQNNPTSKANKNSGIKTRKRYVKLKSILNTVPVPILPKPSVNTPMVESSLNLQALTDADRLKTFLSKQRKTPASNPKKQAKESLAKKYSKEPSSKRYTKKMVLKKQIEESTSFPSAPLDPLDSTHSENERQTQLLKENLIEDPLEIRSTEYSATLFPKSLESVSSAIVSKETKDPLEITPDESTSKSSPLSKTSESVPSGINLKKDSESKENSKKRQDPLEITPPVEATSPQQQTSLLSSSPTRRHILRRVREDLPMANIDKARFPTQQSLIPSRSLKCTHKDMYNKSKTLVLTNKLFPQRKVFGSKDDQTFEIFVPLPQVQKNVRWRMIYLKSDFTFLTFTRANYSVKYTDLMDVVKMSSNIKSTIILRNVEFCDLYKHPQFGIFCVPDYQDRLFIGPFFLTENHNIETLRYLQGRLIDTQIFNKMVGKRTHEREPMWMYESNTRPVSIPKGLVIDITEDDENSELAIVELDSDSSEETCQVQEKMTNSLLCLPFVENLTSDELKTRKVNRYIITNVPHLGYFGAYQREDKAIEVYWPGGTKGYRFPTVTFAKNVLTQYLFQIFCPIPQDFKINVIMMTNLDLLNNKPIDTKYFLEPGPYFCGDFGVCEKQNIPNNLLEQHKTSVGSLMEWHKIAREDEDAIIRIFGLFLMSNEELRKFSDPQSMLQWAISEIYILKKLSQNYETEKTDLQEMIRANSQKIKDKRKEQRNEDTTSKSLAEVSETIEIEDSDEDTGAPNAKTSNRVFKKISASGKIESPLYSSDNERSLLKSNWRSLLKSSDKGQSAKPVAPVKISINHSNIILNKSKLLVTKLK